jgi:hypothetical protein
MNGQTLDVVDVEMHTLRRSARLASKQSQKSLEIQNQTKPLKIKIPSCTTLIKLPIKKKEKKITSRKVKMCLEKTINFAKFKDIKNIKISDMFSLVKLHSKTMNERVLKYSFLQSILKNLKDLKIRNNLADFLQEKHRIVHYLSISNLGTSRDNISEAIEEMLGYCELSDAIENNNDTICNLPSDFDNLLTHMMRFSINTKQLSNEVDDIENLFSKFCM